jgi:hypothetical protein
VWAALPLISSGQTGKAAKVEQKIERKQAQVSRPEVQGGRPHHGHRAGVHSASTPPAPPERARVGPRQKKARAACASRTTCAAPRARLAQLRAKLATSRDGPRARHCVEIYEAGRPDLVTVILNSKGFADLLERGEFMRRISDQDTGDHLAVSVAKARAKSAADHLAKLEDRSAADHRAGASAARNEVAGSSTA